MLLRPSKNVGFSKGITAAPFPYSESGKGETYGKTDHDPLHGAGPESAGGAAAGPGAADGRALAALGAAAAMRIAAYCRVSTDREEQMDSLSHQKRFFETYAARSGYELTDVYADEGISGRGLKNRREFQRMLEDAEQGCFRMIVVKDYCAIIGLNQKDLENQGILA